MEQQQNTPNFRERFSSINYNIERYKVIMHNDDVTTMEFVIMVLMDVFYKTEEEAERLMLEVHNNGSAIVGRYTWDIACTKQQRVQVLAAQEEFPLRVTIKQE
jgi:ATP-dependent Clp protease adaptor protein ClpS